MLNDNQKIDILKIIIKAYAISKTKSMFAPNLMKLLMNRFDESQAADVAGYILEINREI